MACSYLECADNRNGVCVRDAQRTLCTHGRERRRKEFGNRIAELEALVKVRDVEITKLREALLKYGGHHRCWVLDAPHMVPPRVATAKSCTCGWTKLATALEESA